MYLNNTIRYRISCHPAMLSNKFSNDETIRYIYNHFLRSMIRNELNAYVSLNEEHASSDLKN